MHHIILKPDSNPFNPLLHKKLNPKDADEESIVGPGGYIYFGAAKNLPGVRELLRSNGTSSHPLFHASDV